jgi:hypothetical protein
MWNAGALTGEQLYSQPGLDEWVKLGELREILDPGHRHKLRLRQS